MVPILIHKSSKLQKKSSALKREHPALENIKFLKKILFLFAICALLDPDPDSGYGSTDLIESGSNPDQDPGSETMGEELKYKKKILNSHINH
jgi:hypothetical protein